MFAQMGLLRFEDANRSSEATLTSWCRSFTFEERPQSSRTLASARSLSANLPYAGPAHYDTINSAPPQNHTRHPGPHTEFPGGPMTEPSYSDVHRAVRAEKTRIWAAWLSGGIIWLIITNATRNVAVVSVVTQVLLVVLGILSTYAAVRMTHALNRKDDAARRNVLGDY